MRQGLFDHSFGKLYNGKDKRNVENVETVRYCYIAKSPLRFETWRFVTQHIPCDTVGSFAKFLRNLAK